MSIENMFGDLDKIDILAETKAGEVVMVLVCNGFIDGSPETQKALLDKMEQTKDLDADSEKALVAAIEAFKSAWV